MKKEKRFDESKKNGNFIKMTRQKEYQFVSDSYTGDGGYRTGEYLYKFTREGDFGKRKEQAHYRNYVKGVVDSVITPVFSIPAQRTVDSNDGTSTDILDTFLINVDNKGTKIQDFTKTMVLNARLHGVCFCVLDNFKSTDIKKTDLENIESRTFPYAILKTGNTVYHIDYDVFGNIKEISFFHKYEEIEGEKVKIYKAFNIVASYTFYIKDDEKVKVGPTIVHDLGVIPVVILKTTEDDDYLPPSPYYDLCKINRTIYNEDSEQRNTERNSAFAMLVLPGNNSNSSVDVGSDSIIWIDEQSSNMPAFITPPVEILKVLGERSDSNIKSLLEQANTLGATAVETGATAKSGVALGYEFLGQNYTLKETAGYAENFEIALVKLFSNYLKRDYEYTCKYSDNYQPSLKDLIDKYNFIERLLDRPEITEEIRSQLISDIVDIAAHIQKYDTETLERLKQSIINERVLV